MVISNKEQEREKLINTKSFTETIPFDFQLKKISYKNFKLLKISIIQYSIFMHVLQYKID